VGKRVQGMKEKRLAVLAKQAYEEGKRIVAPLMGFPGVELTGSNIKLAQQNFGEHFKAIKRLVETFNPDIVFPLMDLSVEANALGRFTIFPREETATVYEKEKFQFKDLEKLREIDISFDTRLMGYVETMKLMKLELPPRIIRGAYVTGPFSLAALVTGAHDAVMSILKAPADFHSLCDFTANIINEYARLLITAGAEAICILEPTAVMLSPSQFKEWSASYVARITETCKYNGVDTIYHICGNAMHLVDSMLESGIGGLSLDSKYAGIRLSEVAQRVPDDVAIMGNVSATVVMTYGKPDDVRREVIELLNEMKPYANFILSTGCDLPQKAPLTNISVFMKTARTYDFKQP
jgi:uroporphyrinogen decarboxylase